MRGDAFGPRFRRFAMEPLERLHQRLQSLSRKMARAYVRDLRLIHREHRHLYRHKFYTGCCGDALCGLRWAYDAGHLRSQQGVCRACGK